MPDRYIAQINVARAIAPLDDPQLAGFVAQLAEINALADRSPGFVWRLQTAAGDATALRAYDDPKIIVNLSVWESAAALHAYVYRSAHAGVLRDRKRWFDKWSGPYYALWYVEPRQLPTVEEGKARLAHLAEHGPTEHAFWFGAHIEPDTTYEPSIASKSKL